VQVTGARRPRDPGTALWTYLQSFPVSSSGMLRRQAAIPVRTASVRENISSHPSADSQRT
jgi:hypothetical protein